MAGWIQHDNTSGGLHAGSCGCERCEQVRKSLVISATGRYEVLPAGVNYISANVLPFSVALKVDDLEVRFSADTIPHLMELKAAWEADREKAKQNPDTPHVVNGGDVSRERAGHLHEVREDVGERAAVSHLPRMPGP